MVSDARRKASAKYRERNPDMERYGKAYRYAKRLIAPEHGTKMADSVEWAKKDGRYYEDLAELRRLIDEQK